MRIEEQESNATCRIHRCIAVTTGFGYLKPMRRATCAQNSNIILVSGSIISVQYF